MTGFSSLGKFLTISFPRKRKRPAMPTPARNRATTPEASPEAGKVVSKAVLRAADKLNVRASALAQILGVSEATVSRMKNGDYSLKAGSKEFELAVLFVRLFRSLDAVVGGDEAVARSWLVNPNPALGDKPADKIRTVAGLFDVIAYLDARRAII
jgi:uncharacterized protein (DUF2384 family)